MRFVVQFCPSGHASLLQHDSRNGCLCGNHTQKKGSEAGMQVTEEMSMTGCVGSPGTHGKTVTSQMMSWGKVSICMAHNVNPGSRLAYDWPIPGRQA